MDRAVDMEEKTSFADLPAEIAGYICSLLEQCEVSRLSLTTKPNYRLVRPILYRNPRIESYASLIRFQRTITQATWMGKVDRKWSTQDCIDQTKSMDLLIDPNRDSVKNMGQPPAAVMISRMLRCPSLDITLRFAHCRCEAAPISVLENEEFPRVKKLVLYLGKHDPEETHLRRKDRCVPSAKFFRPLVNGMSFPDLKKLEVRHYWATVPPTNASLEIGAQSDIYTSRVDCYDMIGHSDGLKRLESIVLESPPELNSAVLMQLVGNPRALASDLTTLDLRFCQLDQNTLAQLLYHAPPKLKRVSLLCGYDNIRSRDYRFIHSKEETASTHLCPLIREFSKRLERLDFGAAHICRQLFFDDEETLSLRESGIATKIGGNGGEDTDSEKLDVHAIQQTVQTVRQRKRTAELEARIREALAEMKPSSQPSNSNGLFGGSSKTAAAESKVRREMENLLDEEEEQRQRLVHRSTTKWFRRIIAWQGLCEFGDTWAEMKLAAEMEERGVEWVLANKALQVASQHTNGELPIALDYNKALEENFELESR